MKTKLNLFSVLIGLTLLILSSTFLLIGLYTTVKVLF